MPPGDRISAAVSLISQRTNTGQSVTLFAEAALPLAFTLSFTASSFFSGQAKTELCATVSIYSGRLAFRPDTNRTALE